LRIPAGVNRTSRIAAVGVAFGRIAPLWELHREGQVCAPQPSFNCAREITFSLRSLRSRATRFGPVNHQLAFGEEPLPVLLRELIQVADRRYHERALVAGRSYVVGDAI
jgi:hypothetical protein